MVLSVEVAKQIVRLVSGDVVCRARIIGPKLGGFEDFLSGHGWAGPARNIALLYGAGMDSSDPSFQLVDCVGIATATSDALHDVRHKVRVPGTTVSVANRIVRGSYHSATGVAFDRGWYVFDWWRTLDPDNPFIYRHGDWQHDQNPVPFIHFHGF